MKSIESPRSLVLVAATVTLVLAGTLIPITAAPRSAVREATGSVTGRVLFDGGSAPDGVTASDVIVYLLGDGLGDAEPSGEMPAQTMDQFDYTFAPHVLPMLAGTRLTFTNSDSETHNVHTYAKGRRRNRNFNQAQRPGSAISVVFANPDSIRVTCDIHSQMLAHLLVLPNPFFTTTAEDGTFTIANVPAGRHQLLAWHEEYGTIESTIDLEDGRTTMVELDLSATRSTP